MKTMKKLFLFILAALAFVNCTNYNEELQKVNQPVTRAVTSSNFRFNPTYVATTLEGPYENADRYLMMSTGRYLVSDRFFLGCLITNNSGRELTFEPTSLKISLGNSSSRLAVSLKGADFKDISSVSIPANKNTIVYFELPYFFMNERIDIEIPQMTPSIYHVTNIHFYYNGSEQDCSLYNFLFSTHAEQNRN